MHQLRHLTAFAMCLTGAVWGTLAEGFETRFDDLPPVMVTLLPLDPKSVELWDLDGAQDAPDRTRATVILDAPRSKIRQPDGTVLRDISRGLFTPLEHQMQDVIHKMRMIEALIPQAQTGLTLRLEPPGPMYFSTTGNRLTLSGRATDHITVIGLGADGRIALLYPRYGPLDRTGRFDDPPSQPPQVPLALSLQASPPYGTDHIIAIETTQPVPALRRAVARYNGQAEVALLWRDLRFALADQIYRVGLLAIETREHP